MQGVSRPSLICYDGTEPARAAVTAAAGVLAGDVVVVTVWDPVPPLDHARPLDAYLSALGPAPAELDAAAEEQARRIAAEGAEMARGAGLDAEPLAVRSRGRIASTLVAVADERDADLIVVATQLVRGSEAPGQHGEQRAPRGSPSGARRPARGVTVGSSPVAGCHSRSASSSIACQSGSAS